MVENTVERNRAGLLPRLVAVVVLLLLTVPWWPWLGGRVAGLPTWAAFSFAACVIYAGVVAWLLERHWVDGADEAEEDSP